MSGITPEQRGASPRTFLHTSWATFVAVASPASALYISQKNPPGCCPCVFEIIDSSLSSVRGNW